MELAGVSRGSGGCNWGAVLLGLLGPALLAASACCRFPFEAQLPCSSWALQAVPDPVAAAGAALLPWPGGLWAGKLLSCCPHPSCPAPGSFGSAQLPLLLRHLWPLLSCPKGWQGDLACTAAFSASCATTGFSWNLIFPRIMKQFLGNTCNKYCFYRAQNHRRKSGKQTKAGSCEGQQFKCMIMNYIEGWMFLHPWLLRCLIRNNVMDTKECKEFVFVCRENSFSFGYSSQWTLHWRLWKSIK